MQDNFIFKDKYPYKAGHRKVDTSIQSANFINKNLKRISKVVLVELGKVFPKGLTGSELSDLTGVTILTIRPRTSELKLLNLIVDTEKNKNNKGGKPESIYKLRSETLLEEFDIDVSEHKPNTK